MRCKQGSVSVWSTASCEVCNFPLLLKPIHASLTTGVGISSSGSNWTRVVAITIEIKKQLDTVNTRCTWDSNYQESIALWANWQTNTIVIEQDVIVYVSKWPLSCSWYLNYMPPAVTIPGVAMPTHIIILLLGYQPSQCAYYDSASQLYYEYKVWNGPFQECTMTLAADCNVYMWIMHNYAWSRG